MPFSHSWLRVGAQTTWHKPNASGSRVPSPYKHSRSSKLMITSRRERSPCGHYGWRYIKWIQESVILPHTYMSYPFPNRFPDKLLWGQICKKMTFTRGVETTCRYS